MSISPRLRRGLTALAVVLSLVGAPAVAGAQSKSEVERTAAEREAALSRLREANVALQEAVAEYQAIDAELEDLTWRITQLFDRIQDYESQVRGLRERARDLVLEAYMNGSGELMQAAFEAASIQDMLTSQELIDRATDQDLVTLDRLAAVRREMDRLRAELEVDQARVAELRRQSEALVAKLDVLYAQADAEFKAADAEARAAKKAYDEELQRQRLLELARKSGAAAGVSPAATQGFNCPVPGGAFINDWGFPRSGGRTHKGTDVFAPAGTPVRAAENGTLRLKSNSLGGIVAFLKSANFTYYYAHLSGYTSGMSTGTGVAAGDVIGYVGTSGNAQGGAAHLHFEIHPGGGAAVNPYPTLAAAC